MNLGLLAVTLLLHAATPTEGGSICVPGQVAVDADGHCCLPGQSWDSSVLNCVGIPTTVATCGPDQVVVDAVGHCCSPSQIWSARAAMCVAPPPPAPLGPFERLPPRPPSVLGLHAHRLELGATAAYAFTPASISPLSFGLTLHYYFIDSWAVGIRGEVWASGSAPASPSASQWPLQQTSWSAAADFNRILFATSHRRDDLPGFDVYVDGGVGGVSTRPVPVIDPARTYSFKPGIAFELGVGTRLFATSNLALSLELRDTIYENQVESPTVMTEPRNAPSPYGASRFSNLLQLQLGLAYWL